MVILTTGFDTTKADARQGLIPSVYDGIIQVGVKRKRTDIDYQEEK